MRIRVTTSINVRSNTVPSTPAQVNDEFPVLTDVKKIVEKSRSKSPLPFLTPRSNMPSSRFKESQRIPRGSRLSAWLHGFSVVNDERGRPAAHNRKASHTSTYCYSRTPRRRSQDRANGLRPVASTRGVIDPMHSPSTGAWPTNPQNQDRRDQYRLHSNYGAYQTRNLTGMGFLRPKSHHRRPRTKAMQKKGEKSCFPQVTDPKIKRKIIGCLVFGTLLTIVLTICESSFPPLRPLSPSRTTINNSDIRRPRPRNLQLHLRRHLPRRLHLLHPHSHHNIQPLPHPPLHASLQAAKTVCTAATRRP